MSMAQGFITRAGFWIGSSNVLHCYYKDNNWRTLEILFRWNIQ